MQSFTSLWRYELRLEIWALNLNAESVFHYFCMLEDYLIRLLSPYNAGISSRRKKASKTSSWMNDNETLKYKIIHNVNQGSCWLYKAFQLSCSIFCHFLLYTTTSTVVLLQWIKSLAWRKNLLSWVYQTKYSKSTNEMFWIGLAYTSETRKLQQRKKVKITTATIVLVL